MYDLIIIGSGCTGYAAAMYAGRFEMKTLVLGDKQGGTIITTDTVENYPGFKKLSGFELAENLREHALDYPVEMKEDLVTSVEKQGDKFIVKTKKESFESKTILIATGTEWRKLGVPGEDEYANNGVHYCATCDGFAYKGKKMALVGGGDSAAKEALLLTNYTEKVYIIIRGEKVRAEPINMKRLQRKIEKGAIEIINNTNITEIKGDGKLMTKVIFDKEYNGSNEFEVEGLFIEIGHIPLTQLAKDLGVKLDAKNYIKIDRNSKTNIEGVFAAGDCADTEFKQAITGVAEGCLAAYSAHNFISEHEISPR